MKCGDFRVVKSGHRGVLVLSVKLAGKRKRKKMIFAVGEKG